MFEFTRNHFIRLTASLEIQISRNFTICLFEFHPCALAFSKRPSCPVIIGIFIIRPVKSSKCALVKTIEFVVDLL